MVSEEDGGVDGAFQFLVFRTVSIITAIPTETKAIVSLCFCFFYLFYFFVRFPPTVADELTVDGTENRSDNHLVDVVGVDVLPLPALHRAVSDGAASREDVNEVGRGRQQGDDALSECVL